MSSAITRRRFLAGSGAACAAGALRPIVGPQLAFASSGASPHQLVLIILEGGLDGISTLVPAGDRSYGACRALTLLSESSVIPVDESFGLHPSLAPVAELWSDGLVAAVPAIGNTTATRSHLLEMASLANGLGGRDDGTGWIARHLQSRVGGAPTLQGVSSGITPARELRGHPGAFHVPDLANAGLLGWSPERAPAAEAALAHAYQSAGSGLDASAATAFEALGLLRDSEAAQIHTAAAFGIDPWSSQLKQVAQLIRAGIGMEAAVVTMSGWDTHVYQGGRSGRLSSLLDRLGRALSSFVSDLGERLATTTIVVASEFGRRVQENASGGTDHGRGGLALVIGGGINGGVHGTWPGIDADSLDDGDLAVATDTRSLFAEIVANRLGNPHLDAVFPGFTPTPLGIA